MKPRVDFFSEPDFKGKQLTTQDFGKFKFAYPGGKESFTQRDLIGKTFYLIQVNEANGKEWALDNGGTNKQGGLFHLWEWSKDNINQIFTMLDNGVIKCMGNTMTMDVIGGNFRNGTRLHLYPQNNTDAQLWTYDSNTRMVKLKNRNFVLNLHNYEFRNGAILNIWEPNGHESQMWTVKLCEIKNGFCPAPGAETFVVDFRRPFLNLFQQREQFNTCMARLYEHEPGRGGDSGWVGIGDYPTTDSKYSSQMGNLGEFAEWVGKKFFLRLKGNLNFALDTRSFQHNGRGDDTDAHFGIWTFDPNQVNQIWTIDAYGHLGPASNRRYIVGGGTNTNPKMVDNQSGQWNGHVWRFANGRICHQSNANTPHIGIRKSDVRNGSRATYVNNEWAPGRLKAKFGPFWSTKKNRIPTEEVDSAFFYTWYIQECGWFGKEENGRIRNNEISTVVLKPYTDVILYDDPNFKGKILHIHNGKDIDWRVNVYQNNLNFNDLCSSYKVRAGPMDNQQTTDSNDVSGNSVCTIKFQAHVSNVGWMPIVNSGQTTGRKGQHIEAIKFWYTGPGQMYMRCRPNGHNWYDWVTSGEQCGTTGQGRKLDEIEFKIDGGTNVVFGATIEGSGNAKMVNTWDKPGTWKVSYPQGKMETISLSASIKGVQAVSPKTGRVINLVSIPSNWVITDMDIGGFKGLIGKPFCIKSRGDGRFCIDTEGHQNGGGWIKTYTKVADFHENQTWTVDKDGHLISWQNRNSILYIPNSRHGTEPTIIGWKGNEAKANSTKTKWRLTKDGQIVPLYQPNMCLDFRKYENNSRIFLVPIHGGASQKWDVAELLNMDIGGLKQWIGKPFYIKSRGNGRFVLDTEGRQYGGGPIKIYSFAGDMHPNQTWTTDADGHLISWQNRNSILYNASTNNGTRPTIIGWKGQEDKAKSPQSKWRYVDGQLQCLASVNQVIDISGGKYENNTPIILWGKHGGANQKWDFVQVEERPTPNKDIGGFKQWVNKSFVINVKEAPNMIIDTEEHHKNASSWVKLFQKVEDMHPNQTWTVDQDGQITSWDNRDAVLYANNYSNGAEVTFKSAKSIAKDDLKSKWRLMPDGRIENIYDSRWSLHTANNAQQTHVVLNNNKGGSRKWTMTEITPCKWKGKPTIGSMIVGQLTDVVIYGIDTNCKEKSKKITIHNGMRWRPGKDPNVINYRLGDFYKKFGISGVISYEVKEGSIDNTQNEKVEDWDDSKEPFRMTFAGKLTSSGKMVIGIIVSVIALIIGLYLLMKFGGASIAGFSIPNGSWIPVKQ